MADHLKLSEQLCFPLYAASKAIVRQYGPCLEEFDLTYTQYIALLALFENGPMTVQELGEALYLDSGTLSPLLKKLEAKGYVAKERGEDGRYVNVVLTENGEVLRGKLSKIPENVGKCIPLSAEEAKELYTSCYKVLEVLK